MKNFIKRYQDIFLYARIQSNFSDCKTVLDVGCGNDSPIRNVKKTFISEGVDIFSPALKESKEKHIHDSYKRADLKKLAKYYKSNSFDACIALDVIEHFPKNDALKLISAMEKIAKKKVIFLTPNGFLHQGEYGNNPYQRHFSGWSKEEFEKMGYKVYGLRGPKFIRGEFATIKYKPWFLWGLIAFLTEPVLYFFPNLSFDLFAVKDKKK